jgi:hypothetical protein
MCLTPMLCPNRLERLQAEVEWFFTLLRSITKSILYKPLLVTNSPEGNRICMKICGRKKEIEAHTDYKSPGVQKEGFDES